MKLAVVLLACLTIAATTPISEWSLLGKQEFVLQLLHHVEKPFLFGELLQHGEKLIYDKSQYKVFDDVMIQFYENNKLGTLLKPDEFYSAVNKYHILEVRGMYNFLYYAKDFETFVANAVWARINVHPVVFVHAFSLAVMQRADTQDIVLPAIYEILPEMFFNTKYVTDAYQFNMALFNQESEFQKAHQEMFDKKHSKNIQDKYWYLKDWKVWQWWKLMGLSQDWHEEHKCIFRENAPELKNDSQWTALWQHLSMVWKPVDYTRDIEILNEEAKLSYFTEDIEWNAYWYYLNMHYIYSSVGKVMNTRRGEWWLFSVQQMLARYYMERLSHGLGPIEEIEWHGYVKPGYNPHLVAPNGVAFTSRDNFWHSLSAENPELLDKIHLINIFIEKMINTGKSTAEDGMEINWRVPQSIEHIGHLLHGQIGEVDDIFVGYFMTLSSAYLSGNKYHSKHAVPSVFSNYETMMRDPVYYQLLKQVIELVYSFKNFGTPYKHEELLVNGVTISDVQVDKLVTYFDLFDADVTNLMNDEMAFVNNAYVWNKTLLARQMRLNHKPFNVEIKVNSEAPKKVIVSVFLGPSIDEFGQKINLLKHPENWMVMDRFSYALNAGENVIKRSSKQAPWLAVDQPTYSELYNMVLTAQHQDKKKLPMEIMKPNCGFPKRLLLPRGTVQGLPVKIFVMLSDVHGQSEKLVPINDELGCHSIHQDKEILSMPFDYPFDRKIVSMSEFNVPNMYWKDSKVYYMDKYEKHREHKYEHYGSSDYIFDFVYDQLTS